MASRRLESQSNRAGADQLPMMVEWCSATVTEMFVNRCSSCILS